MRATSTRRGSSHVTTSQVFEAAGVDRIVVNAAGCGSAMKDYGELFEGDPQWAERAQAISRKVRDVSQLLIELGEPRAVRHPIPSRVVYHDACHLAHGQGVRSEPRALLQAIPGVELLTPLESDICCGSAGIYNLVQPEPAGELGRRKARHIAALSPDMIATGNPGCTLQIAAAARDLGHDWPIVHPIELLDASIRGVDPWQRRSVAVAVSSGGVIALRLRLRPTAKDQKEEICGSTTMNRSRGVWVCRPSWPRFPIVVLFVMLGVLRKPAWMSAATALASALLVSLVVYRMPVSLALISTIYGAAFGIFPIAWIVFASIMLYRLAVDTGKFEIIKDSIGGLTTDRRLQAMFIAFSFGAFIEGAAGFGAPVAISGAMLAGLGFNPFYAAGICLLANTAPVAFGSIGIP